MTSPRKASVIIPTYKRPDLLRDLLASLSRQQTEYEFEVIAVNDDPEDDLSPMELEFSDISVKIINLTEDHGRSIARNTGVRASSGDIIIFLDDDMTVVDGFITSHMDAHVHPKTAVVGNLVSDPQYARDPLARFIERQGAKKRATGEVLPPKCFRTGNGSVSRHLFQDVGMFDESFRTYGEDLDLAMRLSYKGAEFVFAEDAISYNHQYPDLDDMMEKTREWGRYTLPIFKKTHPEFTKDIWVDLGDPVELGRESLSVSLKKIALRVVLTRPFYAVAKLVYKCKWLGDALFPVIDFMRLYNYLGAYRQSLKDR
jgi:GT2 family glycosyltransferase